MHGRIWYHMYIWHHAVVWAGRGSIQCVYGLLCRYNMERKLRFVHNFISNRHWT